MEHRNPSPPPEFENDSDLYQADSIGGTAISKQWVLKTLMEIINEVERHAENKEEEIIEVNEDLQDTACKLWDICMDKEIAVYLLEFDIIEILYGVVLKSKSPRLTEISIGILGNMACNDVACLEISKLDHLRSVVIALLASPDTPTLLEAVRLIKICVSTKSCCDLWLSSVIKSIDDFASSSQFILSSSTNGKLLGSLSEVIDLLCEKSIGVLNSCCSEEFVGSLLEAISQQCQVDPSTSLSSLCHSLHTLHLISESESGRPVVEKLRRDVGALLSSLFYQWITIHPKVEYNRETQMSSSEVSVSCCLSISSIILDVDVGSSNDENEKANDKDACAQENSVKTEGLENGSGKNSENFQENKPKSADTDDEDRELIIKFSRSVVAAKGIISALPVVSAISSENESSNEFKTPLQFVRNSPRLGTPVSSLLGKISDAVSTVKTPENNNPDDRTPSGDNDGNFTPSASERTGTPKKTPEPISATVLCNLANKVLKTANIQGWIPSGESPKKAVTL